MPGLMTSYDQGYSWKNAEVGKEPNRIQLDKGIVVISWIWQAGGMLAAAAGVEAHTAVGPLSRMLQARHPGIVRRSWPSFAALTASAAGCNASAANCR